MTSSSTDKNRKNRVTVFYLVALFFLHASLVSSHQASAQKNPSATEKKDTLLGLLDIIPSPESIDFVQKKTAYQLHTLLIEQRHPKTWNLSDRVSQNMEAGLRMMLDVDDDIVGRLKILGQDGRLLERAVQAIQEAVLSGRKIYLYGDPETGRWAKWVEGSIWRPFWANLRARKKIWAKIRTIVGEDIENRLIGEMPGADRAIISPMAGWGDLMITGRLQLREREVEPGDVVFCSSASGESPAVIGTIYEALDKWTRRYPYDPAETRGKFFFLFNNPEVELLRFDRSEVVLEEPGITKINGTTGPQALAGSARMQASTIDAFLIAQLLRAATERSLRTLLSDKEMASLGLKNPVTLEGIEEEFASILKQVKRNIPVIARLTTHAETAYSEGRFTTYSALRGLNTLFNDCAERGPTFYAPPLDSVETEPRKSRIQVWAPVASLEKAWQAVLGRPFRGLDPAFYRMPLEEELDNRVIPRTVRESLERGENGQQFLFDFSLSEFNLRHRGPEKEDLGILVIVSPEETFLQDAQSPLNRFFRLFLDRGARLALLFLTEKEEEDIQRMTREISGFDPAGKDILAILSMDFADDPLAINRLIALKLILNAHSTAIMAKSGRVTGNTVTSMEADNPRSIGRGTFWILSHVNDVFKRPGWVKRHGILEPISYGEANAVLFDSLSFVQDIRKKQDRPYEVGISIVRILESLRLKEAVSCEEAWAIVRDVGLQRYLKDVIS